MSHNRSFFEKYGSACFGTVVFAVCMGLVFAPVWPKFMALPSPDSGPYFPFACRIGVLESFLTGTAFTPQKLYWLIFPPLYAHELTYVMDSFLLALAGVYYLRSQRVHPLAAWCGGLALALSGYTLTLFSAGHRGYFHMFSCAVWAFGLLALGFETRKLVYFAMVGAVFAWGVPHQPDVLFLVGLLAGAYVLWLTVKSGRQKEGAGCWKSGGTGQDSGVGCRGAKVPENELGRIGILKTVIHVWPRFGVSVVVLLLAGHEGIRGALTTQVEGREDFFARVMKQNEQSDEAPKATTEAEKLERWNFATSWSLPPEDVLEFIVPGVFGNESMQGAYPYWGRLGRPPDSQFQKGRMMPNYRQHTMYLGVVSVLLALFGVLAWFSLRRARNRSPLHPPYSLCPSGSVYSDVPFWCGVWVLCLILAFGRYTPFYRLFFAIPYMGYIRCPVKFVHLVEIATAFLAGFGMNAFLRTEWKEMRRKLFWVGISTASFLLIACLVSLVARPQVVHFVSGLGMSQAAEPLGEYVVWNLLRSAGFAALVAGTAYVADKWGKRAALWGGVILITMGAVEQANVACRYVRVINVEPLYSENAVVKAVNKKANGQDVNVINYVTPNVWAQDWFSMALTVNNIHNLAPSPSDRGTAYQRIFEVLQKNTLKLWRTLNAQYVIVPRKGTETLVQTGVLRPVLDFEIEPGVVRTTLPGMGPFLLAAVTGGGPGVRAVTQWQGGVAPDKQVDKMALSESVVSQAPSSIKGPGDATTTRLVCEPVWRWPLRFASQLTCTVSSPALLLFSQRFDPSWEVLVDGGHVPCYVSDGVWLSAVVPQGSHHVVVRKKRQVVPFAMSFGVTLALTVWCVWTFWLRGQNIKGRDIKVCG